MVSFLIEKNMRLFLFAVLISISYTIFCDKESSSNFFNLYPHNGHSQRTQSRILPHGKRSFFCLHRLPYCTILFLCHGNEKWHFLFCGRKSIYKYCKKKGTVFTALVNSDSSPYLYFINGKAEGIIPELFSEIQKRTGLSFTIIETKDQKNYQKILRQDNIDVRIDTYANYYNAECSGFKLTATIYPQYKVSFAIGVSTKQDNCLLTILNKSVDSINSDYTEQIISKQATYQKRTISLCEYFISHPGVTAVFFTTIPVILVLLLIFFMRQRNMRILQNKNDELALAITRADKASQSKSRFLSRMSHEMRTPMNAIVGITAIAKNYTDDPEKISDYLNKIDSSSHLLLSIINDVLDMSAIENNKIAISNEPFSLSNCFSAINTLYDVQCRNKGISFILDNKANIDSLIGDQLRLNQILLNLVSNAYKFTEKGGSIQLSAESFPLVPIKPEQKKIVMIQFTVSDTGCGMTEEMLCRLFQPFEQESTDTAQKYGGSGLGLAITKSLVTLMKGTISVKSKKLQGTTFTVLIPFEQNGNEEKSVNASNKCLYKKTDFTGKHFLLAEDNELNREVAVELLTSTNAKIDTAIDGQMAVDIFKNSAPGTYDLILMDMQMPKLNGLVATKQIRALDHPQAKTIPILAMTANAYKEDIDACLEAGMNGHLAKPIEPTILYNSISSFLF